MAENKNIRKAIDELEQVSGDEKIQRIAELREKAIRDETTNLNSARKEGKLEGERNKAKEIAKKMKAKGNTTEEIIEMTELTQEEIEKL